MNSSTPGLKIGSLRGVPVYIGRSWPIIAIILMVTFGPSVANNYPEWGVLAYAVAAAYVGLLLFSVLFHEAAHAVTGQLCGYRVNRIVADLLGGHTAYDTEDATPGKSAIVAAVGPLSNAVLALIGFGLLQLTAPEGAWHLLAGAFTWTNAFGAVFNALPGLPLDGGFLIDALVWKATGNRASGMKVAGWCGRIVAIAVVLWALWPLFEGGRPSTWTVLWTLFIASFLWRGASTAVQVGQNRSFLQDISVEEVLRPANVVWSSTPLAQVPDTHTPTVLLDASGHIESLLLPDAHVSVPLQRRMTLPAGALGVALPPGALAQIDRLDGDIMTVLPAFEGEVPPQFIVVTQPVNGSVEIVGTIARDDVERVMLQRARSLQG